MRQVFRNLINFFVWLDVFKIVVAAWTFFRHSDKTFITMIRDLTSKTKRKLYDSFKLLSSDDRIIKTIWYNFVTETHFLFLLLVAGPEPLDKDGSQSQNLTLEIILSKKKNAGS